MIKEILFIVFTFHILFFFPQATYGCSCGARSLIDNFYSAHFVFIGKVVEIKTIEEASVGLVLKEAGMSKPLKNPRWEKSISKVQLVNLEVVEPFKLFETKTFTLTTAVYNGGGSCGYPFKVGESYLIFTHYIDPMLSEEEIEQPKENWTKEMILKAEADELNKRLPPFKTNVCTGTTSLRFVKEELEEIRGFIKNGKWKAEEKLTTQTSLLKQYLSSCGI